MEDKNLEFLMEFVGNFDAVRMDGWGNFDVEVPFETTAREFLEFAEHDLRNEYGHHLINSLSNVKRAIDCQIDSLLFGFGMLEISRKDRWSFPKKIDFLNYIGIISPRILKRINQKRNLLEHEFKKPLKSEVEDALDVAILFTEYTERFLVRALKDCTVYDEKKQDCFDIELDSKKQRIKLSYFVTVKNENRKIKRTINSGSDKYADYLKFFISLYRIMN
jgi:hypothetical protein